MEIIQFKPGKKQSIHNQLKELNKKYKQNLTIPKKKENNRNKFSVMFDEIDYIYSIAYTHFENKDNKNAIIFFELAQTKYLLAKLKVDTFFEKLNKSK